MIAFTSYSEMVRTTSSLTSEGFTLIYYLALKYIRKMRHNSENILNFLYCV